MQNENQLLMQGRSLYQAGNFQEAHKTFLKVLAGNPTNLEALYSLSTISYQIGNYGDAVNIISKAISASPENTFFFTLKGKALSELGYFKDAFDNLEKAIRLQPDNADALFNRGNALYQLQKYKSAIEDYSEVIRLQPNNTDAFINQGNLYRELKELDLAIKSYKMAIEIEPNRSASYINLGNVFHQLRQFKNALDSFNKAIQLQPNNADAFINQGNLYRELKELDLAIKSYKMAIEIEPEAEFITGTIHHLKMSSCNWTLFETENNQIIGHVELKKKSCHPFEFLGVRDSPGLQKICAETYAASINPVRNSLGPIPPRAKKSKINIGYYSADFYNHATSYLASEIFECHDKNKFEVIAFSFGPNIFDDSRTRLNKAFDQFIDVRNLSDIDIAILSRKMEIDIAIDLKGHTKDCRTGIFSYRAAPIQVNYLGYPGTMGASYMDYIIADQILIPPEFQKFYCENIVYLPHSYQPNDTKRQISERKFSKSELGLPEDSFIFCCFNNNWKITPETFDSWMRLLHRVKGSVLWLLEGDPQTKNHLIAEAKLRGLSEERLIFAKRKPLPEHLARHQMADLFLDTLPCNAHTTASDALWAGLPVLTLQGQSFSGRVAASLLHAIGLPELITKNQEDYESMAIYLANNPNALSELKRKLEDSRLVSPLFDAKTYTNHLEMSYTKMYEDNLSGLLPQHIYIK